MHSWYKFFTYLFYPFALIYLQIRKLKKKEDPIRYKEKLSKINLSRGDGFLVWFHMASVGEAMSVLPLIESYIGEKKIDKILLTSITLSSGKILEKKYKKNIKVFHQYLPLDVPIFTNKFLEHWKPNLSIFVDSEIWPNLILQINKQKIPIILTNARMTEKSFKRWKLIKSFANKIFEKFDLCIASNKESENFLKTLGAKKVINYGNLKFIQNTKNTLKKLDDDLLNSIKNRKIWCAASTHPNEEIMSAKTHMEVKKTFKNILTIIIPRHIDRVNKIYNELSKFNLNVALYSNSSKISENTDILIVDAYGESLKFYGISKNVFVGKSLAHNLVLNSGQNPIEAASLGCKIFHGPNVSNFKEIYEYLKTLNVTEEVSNSEQLSILLVEEFKDNRVKNDEIQVKIQNYGQNIFNNVIVELKKYI